MTTKAMAMQYMINFDFFSFQAFMTYDADQNCSVTKGEFRRVLESFCIPLTTEQFEAVLAKVFEILGSV